MKEIVKYNECTGCHACYNICPKHAISMETEEKTGFKYYKIDKYKCVDCGVCKTVCPVLNSSEHDNNHIAYACYNINEEERLKSSSGGIFVLLAKKIIEQGGVVFGACFDDNYNVVHSYADSIDDLALFMTSKYVQSIIGDTLKKAKEFLDNGKLVYFSGTPCQIEGLLTFLGKDYDNLITQDIICHGVPSPKVWDEYKKFRIQTDGETPISINFRLKDNGWRLYELLFQYKNKAFRKEHHEDLYMKAFLRNASLRDSCYNCSFKKTNRYSDITLADFWGIKNVAPELDSDDKGTSLVIVSSAKGSRLFNSVSSYMSYKEVDFADSIRNNPSYSKSSPRPVNREEFFDNLGKIPFDKLVNKYTVKQSLLNRFKSKIKRLIY